MTGIRLLLVDVLLAGPDAGVRGPGYIHLEGGRISHVGVGEPPEEARIAELVLGGENRVAFPGFAAALVYPEAYALRCLAPSSPTEYPGSAAFQRAAEMGEDEAYHAALMAFYEMALEGYTRVVAATPHPSAVARAMVDAGLWGAVLDMSPLLGRAPAGQPRAPAPVRLGVLLPEDAEPPAWAEVACTVAAGGARCRGPGGEARIVLPGGNGSGIPAPGYPHVHPSQLLAAGADALHALAVDAHRLLDPGYEPLSRGGEAHIAVFDFSEPPGWLPVPEEAGPAALTPLQRVETLVAAGRLVVDGGEHLLVGSEAAEEARRRLSEWWRRGRPPAPRG